MPALGLDGYTGSTGVVTVDLSYTDSVYAGTVDFTYDVTVVRRVDRIDYSADLSVGLKTNYILGETFDPTSLVVNVRYSDGVYTNFTDFSGEEWTFVGTDFDRVGNVFVTLYYGDMTQEGGSVFTRIPVTVTNEISSVVFDESFVDFGEVIEGLEVTVPSSAKLVVTRENGDKSSVAVTKEMLDYRASDFTLGEREIKVSYQGFVLTSSVTVAARSIAEVSVYEEPTRRSYVRTETDWDLDGLVLRVSYDNGTTISLSGARMTKESASEGVVRYSTTSAGRDFDLAFDALVTDFTASYNVQSVVATVTDLGARGDGKADEFTVYCFDKLIKELTFGTESEGDGATVYLNESEDFVFPEDGYIKVTYSDDTFERMSVVDESDEITVLDYDPDSAGFHSVKIDFLLNECTVSTFVRGKVLSDVTVTPAAPEYVSLIEGVPLSADVLNVRLHFVRHDGTEYSPIYYSDVEFSNVSSCTYDENASFFFDHTEGASSYAEGTYSLSYTYGSVTKSADFLVRTYKKKAVSVTMQVLPRSEYIEGESTISLETKDGEKGKILVTYDNGFSVRYDLDNNLVSVSPSTFDGSEIEQGSAPRRQRITVTFHDGANKIFTEYYVTVRDREYLEIDYFQTPTDGIYTFRYGAAATNRPGFNVKGYTINAAGETVLSTMASTTSTSPVLIDEMPDFEYYYLDEDGVRLDEFPTNVGLYNVVVTYTGDPINNAFYENSRYVRILPKELTLRILDKTVVYGEGYDELTVRAIDGEEAIYSWTVSDDSGNTGADALEYDGETVDGIADLLVVLYRGSAEYTFFTHETSGRTIYAAQRIGSTVVGTYDIVPDTESVRINNSNYSFKKYLSGTLTVEKKPVKIVAGDVEKTYGDRDPRLDNYVVFDESDQRIGGSGTITLDNGTYVDNVSGYTLYRPVDEAHEQVGSYEIGAGSENGIANYSLIEYTPATFTINKKAVTLVGAQVLDRYYGHNNPEDEYEVTYEEDENGIYEVRTLTKHYYEYTFTLAEGSYLGRGDAFADVFDFLIDYRYGLQEGMIDVRIDDGRDSDDFTGLSAGTYTVSVDVLSGAENYAVTIEDFSFIVKQEPVTVTIHSMTSYFFDYGSHYWATDLADRDVVPDALYSLSFSEGFALDEESDGYPVFTVVKTSGFAAGRYEMALSDESVSNNGNYVVTVVGDYAAFLEEVEKSEFLPEGERQKSYFIVLPQPFAFTRATEEEYAKKVSVRPILTFDFSLGEEDFEGKWANFDQGFKDYVSDGLSDLDAAFSFTLRNNTSARANLGYYTADTYSGSMSFDYFNNDFGKNFLPTAVWSADSFSVVADYLISGEEKNSAIVLTESFVYEVTPIVLDAVIVNTDCSYTGRRETVNNRDVLVPIAIELADYTLCDGDALNPGYSISVRYYGTEDFVESDMVYHSGDYKIYITGLGNYNYAMSELSTMSEESATSFTVSPISLDIWMPGADANGFVHKDYTGRAIRTVNMNWQEVKDGNSDIGYYSADNGTFKIVNDSGLLSAPKALRIDAVAYVDGVATNPLNASPIDENGVVTPYEYVCSVNDYYVDMSVRFVKKNPSYNGSNEKYIDAEYGFVIDPKLVRLGNMTNGRVNFKDYDGKAPIMANVDKIIIDGEVSADKIDKSRLTFTFARDMAYVPDALKTVITEEDMTSAGYFFVTVGYVNAAGYSNYVFSPESDHYIINRLRVELNLNDDDFLLNKEFDTLAPSAVKSDLRSVSSVSDDIYIELDVKSYRANTSAAWTTYNSINNAGLYAYNFKTYPVDDSGDPVLYQSNRVYFTDYIDETYGIKLLSWNYCYYLNSLSGRDTDGKDGVFRIDPKVVSLSFESASNTAANYVYNRTYDSLSVTAAQAREELSTTYVVRDRAGAVISEERLLELGFASVNGSSVVDGQTVRDRHNDIVTVDGNNNVTDSLSPITLAGESFRMSFDALAQKNTNFEITNRPILYLIVKLEVGLTLQFKNASGDPEMVYGTIIKKEGSGIQYSVIDFADIDAFAEAIHSSAADVGRISQWLSYNEGDTGTKFVFQNPKYYLYDAFGNYNLDDKDIIDAGTYTTNMTGLYSENYSFRIYGQPFTITPKPISISGAHRDYFDKQSSFGVDWSIDGNVRVATENAFMNAVLRYFDDDTALNADAGDYGDSGYYIHAKSNDIDNVAADYPNYELHFSTVTPPNYSSSNLYLALTINKLPLQVALRGVDGNVLSVYYGQVLSDGEYALTYVGMPTLTQGVADYDYDVELAKQNQVKATVKNNILDIPALAAVISRLDVNAAAYTDSDYALDNYLQSSKNLTNFEIIFEDFSFFVNPIELSLRLVNPAGTTYDTEGRFSILIDETASLVYSETERGRLNYSFTIVNYRSIIGYTEGMTISEMMHLVLTAATADNYKEDVAYVITKDGSTTITAGECKIALTNNWYRSINYRLVCEQSSIMVYPIVQFIGNDSAGTENITYSLPYSAISLTGAQGDYLNNIRSSLSMLVRFTYRGLPEGEEVRWVDIRRDPDSTLYSGCDYDRSFVLTFTGDTPDEIKVGDLVGMKMVFTERFYGGSRSKTIETPEFFVRVYDVNDPSPIVKDNSTSDFTYTDTRMNGEDEETVDELLLKGHATDGRDKDYFLTASKNDNTPYSGSIDVVSTDFILSNVTADDYSFALILYQGLTDKNARLSLNFDGGSTFGYYAQLTSTSGTYTGSKTTRYSYLDRFGNEHEQDVRDFINLFDGSRHTVVAYIDKVGLPDTDHLRMGTPEMISGGMKLSYSYDVYYSVTFEIDGRFVFVSRYKGGEVTREITVIDSTSSSVYEYDCYVDFNAIDDSSAVKVFETNPGKVGFSTKNTVAQVFRYTLNRMGVSLSRNGSSSFVQDVRLNPSEDDSVLYLVRGDNLSQQIDYFVVDSSDGYADSVEIDYSYRNVRNGAGLSSLDEAEAGLYLVTATLSLDSVVRTRTFYVCLVETRESVLSLTGTLIDNNVNPETGEGTDVVCADKPITLYKSTGGYAFTSQYNVAIDYTRFVFDYAETGTSSMRIILKGSNNEKIDLSSVDEQERYLGVSLEINRVEEDGVPYFNTTVHVRENGFYWTTTYTDVDWVGERNVLSARYDYVNGVIEIIMERDGVVLFNSKVMSESLPSGLEGGGSAISSNNVRNVIGAPGANGGYFGVHIRNASVTAHELRLTEPQPIRYSLVNVNDGEIINEDGDPIEAGKSYLLSDGRGLPTAVGGNNMIFRFSAVGSGFRLMFNNNTPYFFGGNIEETGATGDRGAGLLITSTGISMFLYKYDVEWKRQILTTANLLDGEEHTIIVSVTQNTSYATISGYEGTFVYEVKIYIDGYSAAYSGYIPVNNDLSSCVTTEGITGGADPEVGGIFDLLRDEFFLSETHYVGIYNIESDLKIKEMLVF